MKWYHRLFLTCCKNNCHSLLTTPITSFARYHSPRRQASAPWLLLMTREVSKGGPAHRHGHVRRVHWTCAVVQVTVSYIFKLSSHLQFSTFLFLQLHAYLDSWDFHSRTRHHVAWLSIEMYSSVARDGRSKLFLCKFVFQNIVNYNLHHSCSWWYCPCLARNMSFQFASVDNKLIVYRCSSKKFVKKNTELKNMSSWAQELIEWRW